MLSYTEFFDEHATLLTAQDLLAIWQFCDLDLELPEHAYAKSCVLWYFDRWLPAVAGSDWWSAKQRYYHILTHKVAVGGEQKVLVTSSSEAFGILVMDNCHSKWMAEFELRKDDPKAKIPKPKKGESENDAFRAKYTESKNGQVKFGGWSSDAFEVFEKYIDTIQKTRDADAQNENNQQKFVMDLMRKHHDIVEVAPNSRKRKSKESTTPAPKKKRLRRLNE